MDKKIKEDVIAYCLEVCPEMGHKHYPRKGYETFIYNAGNGSFCANILGKFHREIEKDDRLLLILHSVLGLDAREKVAEIQKEIDRYKRVMGDADDLLAKRLEVIDARNATIKTERAKSAALVEEITKCINDEWGGGETMIDIANKIIEGDPKCMSRVGGIAQSLRMIAEALEAYRKGDGNG